MGDLAFHARGFELSLASANKRANTIKSYLAAVAQLDAFLVAKGLLAELFGRYPDPADDLHKELFATRAALASLRDSLADIERKLARMPIGSDPTTIRTLEHYRHRSRAELALNEQKLDGLVTSLRGYGEQHTSRRIALVRAAYP